MKKSDFLNKLKFHIDKTASGRSPYITSHAIYFMIKQYPSIRDNKRTYSNILKEIKTHLSSNFDWDMVEVHDCFCRLNRLVKIEKCT